MGVRPTNFTHLNIHAKVTVDVITNNLFRTHLPSCMTLPSSNFAWAP